MRKVVVVGAGYVGLVTGACLAQKDNHVTIVDTNKAKIQSLKQGNVPFYEPGLDELVTHGIEQHQLVFSTSLVDSISDPECKPDIIFSCVGTPSNTDGSVDLSFVYQVAQEIGKHLTDYCLVVNKSTVPVGTTKKISSIIAKTIKKRNTRIDFDIASNPEFLKEGSALQDFFYPDRIVIGTESQDAENLLYDLYKPFLTQNDHFLIMNIASAELTKYASNGMLATRISFMNQLALLADKAGADIAEIKRGMSYDKRIGGAFLNAGVGYGGSCFPKDVKGLVQTGQDYNVPMTLIKEVEAINDRQRTSFIELILNQYPTIAGKTFGIWGLAFKPETDDIRCAPSVDIITLLLEKGAHVIAYDPEAMNNIKAFFGAKITYCNDAFSVIQASDSLVILTEWEEFLSTRPVDFLLLKDKNIFDGRNCFQGDQLAKIGLHYFCIGRMVTTKDTCVTESFWLHNSPHDALF